MKNKGYMDKRKVGGIIIFLFIILTIPIGIFSRSYVEESNYEEVSGEHNKKIYISDFCKDSVVDKSVVKLNNKLKNSNKEDLVNVLLKYYKDTIDEHFGKDSGSTCYNKVNNTINISIKSSNISKEKILESDYEIQDEWNSIISKMANFTRNTKGTINELTNCDVNVQVDMVDIDTNDVIATVKNGEITYSIV